MLSDIDLVSVSCVSGDERGCGGSSFALCGACAGWWGFGHVLTCCVSWIGALYVCLWGPVDASPEKMFDVLVDVGCVVAPVGKGVLPTWSFGLVRGVMIGIMLVVVDGEVS